MVLPRSFKKKMLDIFLSHFSLHLWNIFVCIQWNVYESNYEYGRQLEKINNMKSFIEYKKEQLKK